MDAMEYESLATHLQSASRNIGEQDSPAKEYQSHSIMKGCYPNFSWGIRKLFFWLTAVIEVMAETITGILPPIIGRKSSQVSYIIQSR